MLLPCPFLPYESDTNDSAKVTNYLTKVHHHRREQEENPPQSDSVMQSEEEVSSDDWENDVGLDPNQLTEVTQHIHDQKEFAAAAEQTETKMPLPIADEELDTVMDEVPNDEEPGNVTMNTPMSPLSDISTNEHFTPQPQRTRNPPVMFSYYGLGQPADIRGHIQAISPQVVPMPALYNRPPMIPQYCNQYVMLIRLHHVDMDHLYWGQLYTSSPNHATLIRDFKTLDQNLFQSIAGDL